jgi:hypothetical protein
MRDRGRIAPAPDLNPIEHAPESTRCASLWRAGSVALAVGSAWARRAAGLLAGRISVTDEKP